MKIGEEFNKSVDEAKEKIAEDPNSAVARFNAMKRAVKSRKQLKPFIRKFQRARDKALAKGRVEEAEKIQETLDCLEADEVVIDGKD